MFFFIAGVQPRTVKLSGQSRMCPSCGLCQARPKRTDHYLSVFFIPLLRVKKGAPFLQCRRCGRLSNHAEEVLYVPQERPDGGCPYCGKQLDPSYRFCPFCGKAV